MYFPSGGYSAIRPLKCSRAPHHDAQNTSLAGDHGPLRSKEQIPQCPVPVRHGSTLGRAGNKKDIRTAGTSTIINIQVSNQTKPNNRFYITKMKTFAAAATLLAAAPAVLGQYVGLAARSASPIHYGSINAAAGKFWIGRDTSSYCPSSVVDDCDTVYPGNVTVFGGGDDTLGLYTAVPGGQSGKLHQET